MHRKVRKGKKKTEGTTENKEKKMISLSLTYQ